MNNEVTVATGFACDPFVAEHIAEKNYQLALSRDSSIACQPVRFTCWPYICKANGQQMYGAKYYYIAVNDSPVVENHPSVRKSKKAVAA